MSGNATLQEWNASAVEGADPLYLANGVPQSLF